MNIMHYKKIFQVQSVFYLKKKPNQSRDIDCILIVFYAVETLAHSDVSEVLPSCPYMPSYLVSRKMDENEAIAKGYVSKVLTLQLNERVSIV